VTYLMNNYLTAIPKERNGRQNSSRVMRSATGQSSVPGTGVGGMLLSQTLQDEVSHHQVLLSQLQELGNVLDGQHPQVD
jgi:hypothetical protein